MFDITGAHIQKLSDTQLRQLVYQLATSEIVLQGLPRSGVTAGGHQNAGDGGVDVRVGVPSLIAPDFVPRPQTGFQVKVPDMAAQAIKDEMAPDGVLRPAISDLAALAGAYVIVSSSGSVADQPLRHRSAAMRDAVLADPNAHQLLTRFYDRDRLASWVNKFPGTALWVRDVLGEPLLGWQRIPDRSTQAGSSYILENGVSLKHETINEIKKLSVTDGISCLRQILDQPGSAARIIGLSGLGKTRLVEALFELGVGEAPLDTGLSVYCDFALAPTPSSIDMARRLVARQERAILIVDNCNPATHQTLTNICQTSNSKVSLLTVEYDIRDDEREDTEVFRLVAADAACVDAWLARTCPTLTPQDRRRISAFSDGNFRIAGSLARTVRRGESLANLRDADLFDRLFLQRNVENSELLECASLLALQYSFSVESTNDESELAKLAELGQKRSEELFASTAELASRGLVQARGHWRAILPHAIAHNLASRALARLTPAVIDRFAAQASGRVLRSFSRRVGLLHTDENAQALVNRWLKADGPIGDLFENGELGIEILQNLAPVAPEQVLARISSVILGPNRDYHLSAENPHRGRLIGLVKQLAYESGTYQNAAEILAEYAAIESKEYNNTSAVRAIKELHQIRLSGTMAVPALRQQFVRSLLETVRPELKAIGLVALNALLHTGPFSSSSSFDFGARPRDIGWRPQSADDISSWFVEAIRLAMAFEHEVPNVKTMLASSIRQLSKLDGCRDEIEAVARYFTTASTGWIDGWHAVRATLRYDKVGIDEKSRAHLVALEELLRPRSALSRAEAYVLRSHRGDFDIFEGEADDPAQAQNRAHEIVLGLGVEFASDQALFDAFLPEVMANDSANMAFEFGVGLCRGSAKPEATWQQLVDCFLRLPAEGRSPRVLGGFMSMLQKQSEAIANSIMDAVWDNPKLRHFLPYLMTNNGINAPLFERLISAARSRLVSALDLGRMRFAIAADDRPELLAELLLAISDLEGGHSIAFNMMFFYIHGLASDDVPQVITDCARVLLNQLEFTDENSEKDFYIGQIIIKCLRGPDSAETAAGLCERLSNAAELSYRSHYEHQATLEALFEVQPEVALNCLILNRRASNRPSTILEHDGYSESAIVRAGEDSLLAWARKEPLARFPALCEALPIIITPRSSGDMYLSPTFLTLLTDAPDKLACLGNFYDRVRPKGGWSGSLAATLEARGDLLKQLAAIGNLEIDLWLTEGHSLLPSWISREREREGREEQSFE